MKRFYLFLAGCVMIVSASRAQVKESMDSLTSNSYSTLANDSILSDDALLQEIRLLLDSMKVRRSFFSIYMGAGNRLFSIRNNNFNAQQTSDSKFSLTPSATYFHKSGLGLTATSFVTIENSKMNFYQYALSPSFDYLYGRKVVYGISYAHYFTKDDLNFYATPFKDELYGYIRLRHSWLEPGLSIGYARGKYKDIFQIDTTVLGIPTRIRDTSLVAVQDFSIVGAVSHSFSWTKVFSRSDNLTLFPQLSLAAGFQQFDTESSGQVLLGKKLKRVGRNYAFNSMENTGLRFQSIACSVNLSYFIGKFVIAPQYYLNYYIPESDKKFLNIFSLMAGYTF